MARVAWAIIANGTYNNPNNQLVIDNPLPMIGLETFPNNYSFSIAFSLIELYDSRDYNLNIFIGNDNGVKIVEANINLIHEYDRAQANDIYVSDINLNNVRFPSPGLYHLKLTLDAADDPFTIYFLVREVAPQNGSREI